MILINESNSQSAYELAENFKKHKELWLKILAYKLRINPENITDVAVGIQNREKIRWSYEDKMDALIVKTNTRLQYSGGFEVLVVNDRNRRMEPAVSRIMVSANKGSSVDIMAGLLLPEGRPNWKSLERSYNVNDVIVVYSDVDLPPEMPGDTEHLYLNPKDQYNRLDIRDKDPILGVRGLNVDESDELPADEAYAVLRDAGFDVKGVMGDQELLIRLTDPTRQEEEMNVALQNAGYGMTISVDYDEGNNEYTCILNSDDEYDLNESKTGDVSYVVQLKPIKGGSIVNKAVAWLDQNAKIVQQPVEMTVDQANAAVEAFNTHLPRGWGDTRASIKLLNKHEKILSGVAFRIRAI